MRKTLFAVSALAFVALVPTMMLGGRKVEAAASKARYTADGKLILPKGNRSWVFIGAPLTPNGLNGGKAGFPDFTTSTSRSKTWKPTGRRASSLKAPSS